MTSVERTVVRDGVRLVCRDHGGGGPSALLLHGLAGHAGEWDATTRWLRTSYRVVAPDQRGHGASQRHPPDVSRAAHVADAVAVTTELALGPVVLVGQSLGGHTAMLTAAARPDLVRALVLVEASPGGPDPAAPARIGRWLDAWPVPFASREAAAAFFGGGRRGWAWAAGLEQHADGWHPRFDREVLVESLTEISRRAFWREWAQVRCPTLVVLAEGGIVPAGDARTMVRLRPETTLVEVPDAGHDLHLERPEALQDAMTTFLDALHPPRARSV